MNIILDTNILVLLLRNGDAKEQIEQEFGLFDPINRSMISIVSMGEIKSLAIRNKWGIKRLELIEATLKKLVVINVAYLPLINKYAEIDNFSQGTSPNKPLGLPARNMGKNDLWIAATAAISNATLHTTDNDFNHLDGHYFKVEKVKI
jgi:tRNA(fMet)-specific endonuclease VapC